TRRSRRPRRGHGRADGRREGLRRVRAPPGALSDAPLSTSRRRRTPVGCGAVVMSRVPTVPWGGGGASDSAAAPCAERRQRFVEDGRTVLLAAALLHVREVRLVRLVLDGRGR